MADPILMVSTRGTAVRLAARRCAWRRGPDPDHGGHPPRREPDAGSVEVAAVGKGEPTTDTGGLSVKLRRGMASFLAVLTLAAGGAACGDDPGEDQIGDNEIIDEGD